MTKKISGCQRLDREERINSWSMEFWIQWNYFMWYFNVEHGITYLSNPTKLHNTKIQP
jgi:hypothetical protein